MKITVWAVEAHYQNGEVERHEELTFDAIKYRTSTFTRRGVTDVRVYSAVIDLSTLVWKRFGEKT